MPNSKYWGWFLALLILGILVVPLTAWRISSGASSEYSLAFDPDRFAEKTLKLDNRIITYRAYEEIVYVSNPVDIKYQNMNFYVPAEYYEGRTIGTYTAETAPIFFPNTVGGYMPGAPGSPGLNRENHPNAASLALARGYVVAAPGARGRTLKNEKGLYTGKAPACIVNLKAAVRYLRYNDEAPESRPAEMLMSGLKPPEQMKASPIKASIPRRLASRFGQGSAPDPFGHKGQIGGNGLVPHCCRGSNRRAPNHSVAAVISRD